MGTTEGAAFGAALLASMAAGWFPSVDDALGGLVQATPVAAPGPEAARYAATYDAFRDLYPALRPLYHRR